MSSRETTCDIDQLVAPPTSMYSMNRSSAPRAFANSSSGMISSSLTPRITTVSILKPGNVSTAASMPASTRGSSSNRASLTKRSRCSVSRLIVSRCRPARLRSCTAGASSTALVVIARSRIAVLRASRSTRAGRSRRSSGSPPVSRTLSTPKCKKLIDEPIDFLELQDVFARQPEVVLLGHAVLTSQIAAIGHRQPQVGQRPLVGV